MYFLVILTVLYGTYCFICWLGKRCLSGSIIKKIILAILCIGAIGMFFRNKYISQINEINARKNKINNLIADCNNDNLFSSLDEIRDEIREINTLSEKNVYIKDDTIIQRVYDNKDNKEYLNSLNKDQFEKNIMVYQSLDKLKRYFKVNYLVDGRCNDPDLYTESLKVFNLLCDDILSINIIPENIKNIIKNNRNRTKNEYRKCITHSKGFLAGYKSKSDFLYNTKTISCSEDEKRPPYERGYDEGVKFREEHLECCTSYTEALDHERRDAPDEWEKMKEITEDWLRVYSKNWK